MFLKRIFDHDKDGKPTSVSHIKVLAGPDGEWHASTGLVEKGQTEGWLSFADRKISIKTAEGEPDLVFNVVRGPGHYCCHCGVALGDEWDGRRHVLREHAGIKPDKVPGDNATLAASFWKLLGNTESPDSNNPAGYRRDNFYTCEPA